MNAARRVDRVLLVLLATTLMLRVHTAATQAYVHDEDHTSIPLSRTISFSPAHLNLPLRGENHGALPAYFVKASSVLFGTTPLGYRLLHILVSLCTIVLIYSVARDWYGPVAGRWAAALMAFNEYYAGVSARATAHVPHLFFVALAVFAFSRLLVTSRVRFLYLACAAVGLAFYCKEHAALVLPVLLATLLLPRYRRWFRSPHLYLALGTFVLIIGVDLIWNLTVDSRRAQVSYAGETVAQATYASHLKRIGGLGLSPYPAMFYGHSAVMTAHRAIVGSELTDETPEYNAVDAVLGLLLVSAVAIVTVQSVSRANRAANAGAVFLLLLFWGIFGFFTLIKKGSPPGRLDPVSWIWVEVTIIPAAILTASWLANVTGGWRIVLWAFAASVLVYASAAPALALVRRGVGAARELLSQSSHMVQLLVMWFVDAVRLHPLRVTAIVFALGLVVGAIVGYLVALRVRRRLSAGHESPTS